MPSRDNYREIDSNIIGSGDVTSASPPADDSLFGYDSLTHKSAERQPDNLNPLYPTYFQFSLEKTPKLTYFCQSVNLPGMSLNMIPQSTRFVNIPQSAGSPEFDDLTVNFLVDENLTNWLEIWNWMRTASNTKDHTEYIDAKDHYSDASLVVLNSAMNAKIRVEFENIIPTSISALEFDSTVSNPDAMVATATFQYTTYEIINLS
jgi:hypothetical protein